MKSFLFLFACIGIIQDNLLEFVTFVATKIS